MASQASVETNQLAHFVTSTNISELMKNATGESELQGVDDAFSVNSVMPGLTNDPSNRSILSNNMSTGPDVNDTQALTATADTAAKPTQELRVVIKAPENADRAVLNRTVEQHVQRLAEEGKITESTQVVFVVEKGESQDNGLTSLDPQRTQAMHQQRLQVQSQQAQHQVRMVTEDSKADLQSLLQVHQLQDLQLQSLQQQQQSQQQQTSQHQQQPRIFSTSSLSGLTVLGSSSGGSGNVSRVVISQPSAGANTGTPLRVFYTQPTRSETSTTSITSGGTPLQIRAVTRPGISNATSAGVVSGGSPSISPADLLRMLQQNKDSASNQPQQQQLHHQQQVSSGMSAGLPALQNVKLQINTAKLKREADVVRPGGSQSTSSSQPSIVLMAGPGQEQRVIPISQLKLLTGSGSSSSSSAAGSNISVSLSAAASGNSGTGLGATTSSGKQVILLQCGSTGSNNSASNTSHTPMSVATASSVIAVSQTQGLAVTRTAGTLASTVSSGTIPQQGSTLQSFPVLNSPESHQPTFRPNTSPDSSVACQSTPPQSTPRTRGGSSLSPWQQYVKQFQQMEPCPICGDRVSGYHYGIFCCESCKGFFKRTVQNQRSYACHRGPNDKACDINTASRKKCPACRFRRCMDKGMKVEAIRIDRQRGGRSMYPGARTRAVIRTPSVGGCAPSSPSLSSSSLTGTVSKQEVVIGPSSTAGVDAGSTPQQQQTSLGTTTGLGHHAMNDSSAAIPQIYLSKVLTEIVSVERVIAYEEDKLEFSSPREGEEEEAAVYRALIDLAEQRLYRLVRWSRSLPEFSNVDTDDQIALLQNCWSELLCLDCCWRSLSTPQEIRLTANKCINLDAARELGAASVVNLILTLTADMHRLQVDLAEYASLKVILLMQPDIPGLKAAAQVRRYQESVSQSLMKYTLAKFPQMPDKFSAMLVRLPELGRVSGLARDMLLKQDLTPYLKSSSLLMELLRSDREAQNSQSSGGQMSGLDITDSQPQVASQHHQTQ